MGGGVAGPAASFTELLRQRRALIFIGIWMATNFVFGAGAQTLGASEAPVAWVAHVGRAIATLRDIDVATVGGTTSDNFFRLFKDAVK